MGIKAVIIGFFGLSAALSASSALSQTPTPGGVYGVADVAAVVAPGAQVRWFGGASVGADTVSSFVSDAAERGARAAFRGGRPARLTVRVERMRLLSQDEAPVFGGAHEIEVTYQLSDPASGQPLFEERRRIDLFASSLDSAAQQERRVAEWIDLATASWAKTLTCQDVPCGGSAVAARAPAPSVASQPPAAPPPDPAPSRVVNLGAASEEPRPAPQPAPQPETQAAPAPQVQQPAPEPEPAPQTAAVDPAPQPARLEPTRAETRAPAPQAETRVIAPLPTVAETPREEETSPGGYFPSSFGEGANPAPVQPEPDPRPRFVKDLSGAISLDD